MVIATPAVIRSNCVSQNNRQVGTMKKNYPVPIGLALLLLLIGCGDSGNKIVNTTEKGAEIRMLDVQGEVFDVCDPSSRYSITVEVDDFEGGDLLDFISVFVSFVEMADDGTAYPTSESEYAVFKPSSFPTGPNDLPTIDFGITLQEISSALDVASYESGDVFKVRFEAGLTDGRSISSYGGSPFVHEVGVADTTVIDSSFFSGLYLMEQIGGADPFYGSETFGDSQTVSIAADGNMRSFDFLYYPGIFDADYHFQMELQCGEIETNGRINAGGLGCGSNIGFSTGGTVSTYDESFVDDAVITVYVTDFDPGGSCSGGAYQVELRFTKQ